MRFNIFAVVILYSRDATTSRGRPSWISVHIQYSIRETWTVNLLRQFQPGRDSR